MTPRVANWNRMPTAAGVRRRKDRFSRAASTKGMMDSTATMVSTSASKGQEDGSMSAWKKETMPQMILSASGLFVYGRRKGPKTSGWGQKRGGRVQSKRVGSKVNARGGGRTGSDNDQCTDLKDLVATDVSQAPGPCITPKPMSHLKTEKRMGGVQMGWLCATRRGGYLLIVMGATLYHTRGYPSQVTSRVHIHEPVSGPLPVEGGTGIPRVWVWIVLYTYVSDPRVYPSRVTSWVHIREPFSRPLPVERVRVFRGYGYGYTPAIAYVHQQNHMGLASPVQVPQVPTGPQYVQYICMRAAAIACGAFEAQWLVRGAHGSFAVQVAYFEVSGSVTTRVVFLKREWLVRGIRQRDRASGVFEARVVLLKREWLVRGANGSFAVQVAYFEASGSVIARVVFLKCERLVRGANGLFEVRTARSQCNGLFRGWVIH
ncbi:hypothetical protein BU15DRAFT_57801 [Melanogaster broomeanus]|nr:hypothetical protein BU15DRAFT_57801 [Melanogaster broomeanus]